MTIRHILIVPNNNDEHDLLSCGPCGARPPQVRRLCTREFGPTNWWPYGQNFLWNCSERHGGYWEVWSDDHDELKSYLRS